MTTPTESLSVVLDLPPAPLVLASGAFLSTLAQVEGQIATLAIKDAQTAQQAADLQTRLTKAGTELEKARKNLKQPYIDAGRKIDEIANAPALRIEAAKSSVKRLLVAYDQEQAKIAADLERKRQEELRKLREQADREEAASKRRAADLADQVAARQNPLTKMPEKTLILIAKYNPAQIVATSEPIGDRFRPLITASDATPMYATDAVFFTAEDAKKHAELILTSVRNYGQPPSPSAAPVMELDDEPEAPPPKTETEKRIEALVHAPVAVVAKPTGIAYRTTLIATVVDVAKLPNVFVERTPKLAAIRQTFTEPWKEGMPIPVLDGCLFEIKRQSVSTGRQTF